MKVDSASTKKDTMICVTVTTFKMYLNAQKNPCFPKHLKGWGGLFHIINIKLGYNVHNDNSGMRQSSTD